MPFPFDLGADLLYSLYAWWTWFLYRALLQSRGFSKRT
jgi:hypothetical protein